MVTTLTLTPGKTLMHTTHSQFESSKKRVTRICSLVDWIDHQFPPLITKALLGLALVATLGGKASAQFPACYERLAAPTANYDVLMNVSADDPALQDPSMRIVDLEIERFAPNQLVIPGGQPPLMVSVSRVENAGDMFNDSTYVVNVSEAELNALVDEGDYRILDIEMNYHESYRIFGVLQPRYSAVLVGNSGMHAAVWDWIPEMPEAAFEAELAFRMVTGYRPTDIEYRVKDGAIYATALLAQNETYDFETFVPTIVQHFNDDPASLGALEASGWRLLDVEKAPPNQLANEWEYIGIFVMSLNHDFVGQTTRGAIEAESLINPNRLIDLERKSRKKVILGGGIGIAKYIQTYFTARLTP